MDHANQIPLAIKLLKDDPQASPIQTLILRIKHGKMIFYEFIPGIELGDVVYRVSTPDCLVESNHLRAGKICIIDEALVVLLECHPDRLTGAIESAPGVTRWIGK